MGDLKRCPFCGSRAVAQGIWGDRRMSVRCMGCDASGPSTAEVPEVCIEPHKFVAEAIAAWNRRALSAPAVTREEDSSARDHAPPTCATQGTTASPTEDAVCPACWAKYRGRRPEGFGDDPVCAFPHGARFSHENWNCAALDPLRDLIGEFPGAVERDGITVVQNWDQKVALVVIHDNIDFPQEYEEFVVALAVTWYKRRGRTDAAWLLCADGTAIKPTYGDIAAICAGYAAPADGARRDPTSTTDGDAVPGIDP